MSGASRWLEAWLACGPGPRTSATVTAAAIPRTARSARVDPLHFLSLLRVVGPYSAERAVGSNRLTRRDESAAMAVLALPAPGRTRVSMARDLAHLSDEALVALIARSDDGALEELYSRFGRIAYGLALRVLRDPALAEDAVQDAFLTVWRTAARFVPERAKASTWLLTLVHRRAVDVVRREQPRRTEHSRPRPSRAPGQPRTRRGCGFSARASRTPCAAFPINRGKPSSSRTTAASLRGQLADRLGEPLGTIKSRMFAGLARMRELLAEPDHQEERWNTPRSTS